MSGEKCCFCFEIAILAAMSTFFSADFFRQNRERLIRERPELSLFIISANASLQSSADMSYRFRQDSHFWYLTGLSIPEATLVIDVKKSQSILLVPEPNDYVSTFDRKVSLTELKKISGVDVTYWYNTGWTELEKRMKHIRRYGMTMPHDQYIETYAMYANPARANLEKNLLRSFSASEAVDIRMTLARMRQQKQPQEIQAIRQAIAITKKGLEAILTMTHSAEYEVEAAISYAFRANGALGHGYEPIVAGAERACLLHYHENQASLQSGDALLIDTGAVYEQYTADITRMFSIGEPSERYKAVYEAVKGVAKDCATYLKPGITMRQFSDFAEQKIGEKLLLLGLISSINQQQIRQYYPHSISHFLGIDAHDAGDYDQPLSENSVITIEPGIYIPEEKLGIRLEDDYLVTATGAENLSAAISQEIIVL
jgi:Xaa-Pro aminopeptidase